MTRRSVDEMLRDRRAGLSRVTAVEAYDELRTGAVLVDVRPESQRRDHGVIEGAVVVDRNVLEWRLDPASPHRLPWVTYGTRVIVVCQQGYSSSLAAAALQELGLAAATDLVGGFEAWQAAGLPVSRQADGVPAARQADANPGSPQTAGAPAPRQADDDPAGPQAAGVSAGRQVDDHPTGRPEGGTGGQAAR